VPRIGESVEVDAGGGGLLALTLLGIRWSVARRTVFLSGKLETGRLHAARLRIANTGDVTLGAERAAVTVRTAGGELVEADLLADLSEIAPGEMIEGWVVFEVATYCDEQTRAIWALAPGERRL
jgi:hypothetical protein